MAAAFSSVNTSLVKVVLEIAKNSVVYIYNSGLNSWVFL